MFKINVVVDFSTVISNKTNDRVFYSIVTVENNFTFEWTFMFLRSLSK